jgi:hypothetical protein
MREVYAERPECSSRRRAHDSPAGSRSVRRSRPDSARLLGD